MAQPEGQPADRAGAHGPAVAFLNLDVRRTHARGAALREFGAVAEEPDPDLRLESRSGAGVHAVRTSDGRHAYLKLTPSGRPDTERELRFYLQVAPGAPVRTPSLLGSTATGDGVALLLEATGAPVDIEAWTPAMWASVGRNLAALHAMPLPAGAGWESPDPPRRALDEVSDGPVRTWRSSACAPPLRE